MTSHFGRPRFVITLAVALSVVIASSAPARSQRASGTPTGLFVFDSPFWLNLHQFLYVLGRAQAKLPNSGRRAVVNAPADQAEGLRSLPADQQQVWQRAVDAYANGLSRQDAVFDEPLVELAGLLIAIDKRPSLDRIAGLDPAVTQTLSSAAPIYRTVWWPRHEAANRAVIKNLESLLARYGEPVLRYVTRVYGQPWPAGGFPVHFSGYANWAGAFSTRGPILIMSSLDFEKRDVLAFETVFHEAMHQWDDQIFDELRGHAQKRKVEVPPDLSHAMIFFTAGEAVKSVIPTHVPYAESEGVWSRSMGTFRPALEAVWLPYLRGSGTREQAMATLIEKTAVSR